MTMKLTRKQIKETLANTPIETVLLGATTAKTKLTAKQKAFAEKVAQGLPKAQAYRESYNSTASKQQQAHAGHMLSLNPKIQQSIDAFKVANEAMKYQNAEQLRALAVHRLTQIAIDGDVKPAQQLKALELIGKITEVALFTERREVVKITDTAEAKAKLIESLKLAMRGNKPKTIDADYIMADDAKAKQEQADADSLLAELSGHDDEPSHYDDVGQQSTETEAEQTAETETDQDDQGGIKNEEIGHPPTPDPLKEEVPTTVTLHSIPHNESPSESN